MTPRPAPHKTPEGQAELAHRVRGLNQRYRTVLLLVDGRRSWDQVQALATQAGVEPLCLSQLLDWGLVSLSPQVAPPAVTITPPATMLTPGDDAPAYDSSMLPPARSLAPESSWQMLDGAGAADGFDGPDRPFEEARDLLIRAVRNEAPVAGSLTLMKLKRASNRNELAGLLDEVESRIRKPRRLIIAAQTLRHVRHLLSLPPSGIPVA